MATTPKISNPVQLDPLQEIVDCHFGPNPAEFEYIIVESQQLWVDNFTIASTAENPTNAVDEIAPPDKIAFFQYLTGNATLAQRPSFDQVSFISAYNHKGVAPSGPLFDQDKLSMALTAPLPVTFPADNIGYGVLFDTITDTIAPPSGGWWFRAPTDGSPLNDLPGEMGGIWNGYFTDGSARAQLVAVQAEGVTQFWGVDDGGSGTPQSYASFLVSRATDGNATLCEITEVTARTVSVSISYDGKPFRVIGVQAQDNIVDGMGGNLLRFRFICQRERTPLA
jgi:hypothetical protein